MAAVEKREIQTADSPRALIGVDAEVLWGIYEPDVNLCVWRRSCPAALNTYLQALKTDSQFSGLVVCVEAGQVAEVLMGALPRHAGVDALVDDVVLLAELFDVLFEPRGIGLRLTPLASAMCPRFHVDRVPCRLVCSYGDAGTEWLPESALDRSRLGSASAGLADEVSGIFDHPTSIRRLAPGDVALLKGEAWEGNEGRGLVHRSPSLPAAGFRLLVTLDVM